MHSKVSIITAPTLQISIQQAGLNPLYVYHFCGGTLIHHSHVLTAAHCVTTESGAVMRPSFVSIFNNGSLALSDTALYKNKTFFS